jgi:hypothetical protein
MDEQKPKTIGELTSEELGLALNQQHQILRQAEINILQINTELEQRKKRHDEVEKETT